MSVLEIGVVTYGEDTEALCQARTGLNVEAPGAFICATAATEKPREPHPMHAAIEATGDDCTHNYLLNLYSRCDVDNGPFRKWGAQLPGVCVRTRGGTAQEKARQEHDRRARIRGSQRAVGSADLQAYQGTARMETYNVSRQADVGAWASFLGDVSCACLCGVVNWLFIETTATTNEANLFDVPGVVATTLGLSDVMDGTTPGDPAGDEPPVGPLAWSWRPPLEVSYKVPTGLFEPDAGGVTRITDQHIYHTRFCCCNEELIQGLESRVSGPFWYCVAHVPTKCTACCPDLKDDLLSVPTRQVRVFMSNEVHHSYVVSACVKDGNAKKNVAITMTHSLEGKDATEWNRKQFALMTALPFITCLQSCPLERCLCYTERKRLRMTRYTAQLGCVSLPVVFASWPVTAVCAVLVPLCYGAERLVIYLTEDKWFTDETGRRWCSEWRYGASVEGPVSSYGAHPASLQEEVIDENDGEIPLRVVARLTETQREVLVDYEGPTELPPSDLQDLIPLPFLEPIEGVPAMGVCGKRAWRVGPMLGAATVYHPGDWLTKLSAIRTRLCDKVPYVDTSAVAKRMVKYTNAALKFVFTKQRIRAALLTMPLIQELGASKYSPEAIEDAISRCMLLNKMPMPEGQTKLEAVAKKGKPPRIIINEGLLNQLATVQIAYVWEKILFDHFKSCSIKHKTRREFMDEMTAQMSSKQTLPGKDGRPEQIFDMVGIEIDQTRFDNHQTMVDHTVEGREGFTGLLSHEKKILDRIYECIGSLGIDLWTQYEYRVEGDKKCRNRLAFRDKPTNTLWVMVFDRLFRNSGSRITSSGNAFQEVGASLSSMTLNPEHIWTDRLAPDAHIYIGLDNRKIYLRFWVEGDDFAGQSERRLKDLEQRILQNFHLLGLEAKLVFVIGTKSQPARLEFCGAHMLMIDGLTQKGVWCPDIVRSLIVSGVYCSSDDCVKTRTASVVASFWMRATMFVGRCDPMAYYYAALALEWEDKLIQLDGTHVVVRNFDVKAILGEEALPISGFERNFHDAESEVALPTATQIQLINASTGSKLSPDEYGAWRGSVETVTPFCLCDDVYPIIPSYIRTRCQEGFTRQSP